VSETENCHYVSRFQTVPWEVNDRRLVYYDFEAGKIGRHSSRTLYSKHRLNDQATENLLSRLIEDPLGKVRKALTLGSAELPDWPSYRAAALFVQLQGPRSASTQEGRDCLRIRELLSWPEPELDQFVHFLMEGKRLLTYRVPKTDRLFFPSTGLFALPLTQVDNDANGGIDYGWATPLDQRTFLAVVPTNGNFEVFHQLATDGQYFLGLSTGLHAKKVVIPPDMLGMREAEIIENIQHWRQTNVTHVQALEQMRTMAREMFEQFGVRTDHGERLRRVGMQRESDRTQAT